MTDGLKVVLGLALSPFLYEAMMDRFTDEVTWESPWTMIFIDGIMIRREDRELLEESLRRWRYVPERRRMEIKKKDRLFL